MPSRRTAHRLPSEPPARRRAAAASGRGSSSSATSCSTWSLAPGARRSSGDRRPGPRPRCARAGRATTTARWLGRLGRAQHSDLRGRARRGGPGPRRGPARGDGVTVRAVRVAGAPTGRIGVLVEPAASARSCRTAAPRSGSGPRTSSPTGSRGADALHLPAYSLLDQPLGARRAGGDRSSPAPPARSSAVDLASIAPLLADGPPRGAGAASRRRPGPLFATADEAEALLGRQEDDEACSTSRRSPSSSAAAKGATILARDGERALRFEVATTPHQGRRHDRRRRRVRAPGSSSAGSDAGASGRRARRGAPAGAVAGNRAALRHLSNPPGRAPARLPRPELPRPTRAGSGRTSRASASCRSIRRSGRPASP